MELVARLDVSGVRSHDELHDLIAQCLGFPDYYGRNWDAFDECIADSGLELPSRVVITGVPSLEAVLPREAELLRRCFSYSSVRPEVTWGDPD